MTTNDEKAQGRLQRFVRSRAGFWSVSGGGVALAAIAVFGVTGASANDNSLVKKMQEHFPNTKVSAASCKNVPGGLCEVVAGENVFYATKDGRYAFVGSMLDLEKKVDLTEERSKQVATAASMEARIGGVKLAAQVAPQPSAPPPSGPSGAAPPSHLKVTLPAENAIVHHKGAPIKITVISDLNCSYCQKLHMELKDATDIEVTEFPTNMIGGGEKGQMVLCADDREAAANSAYQGGQVRTSKDCAGAGRAILANSEFAHASGLQGTPAIIFADGSVNPGYMPIAQLRQKAQQASGRPAAN